MSKKTKHPRFPVPKTVQELWKSIVAYGVKGELLKRSKLPIRTVDYAINDGIATLEVQKTISNTLAEIKKERAAELKQAEKEQLEILKTA